MTVYYETKHGSSSIERKLSVFRAKNGGPKVRLVALGCRQPYGVDYRETFTPVVKLSAIRILLALAAKLHLECEHF